MFYKIGRLGPTDSYPWDSTEKTEVSADGKRWIKVKNTDGFPEELRDEAFGYKLHRGEYKEWVMEVEKVNDLTADEKRKLIDKAWKWIEQASSKFPIKAEELTILHQSFNGYMGGKI